MHANQRRKERSHSKNRQVKICNSAASQPVVVPKLDVYLALNNNHNNFPSPLSQSPRSSSSSDESHGSSISSWQRHQPISSCVTTRSGTAGDPINHLENEVAKLTALLKRHKKYTPEWFVLDTKLSAAKEELDAAREDRDLDFLDMDEPRINVTEEVTHVAGIPETVLVRSEEIKENQPKVEIEPSDANLEVTPFAKMSATQGEYQMALQKLNKVDKFSDEWFLLQEQVIELRIKVMEEAVNNATQLSAVESPTEVDMTSLPSQADERKIADSAASSYLVPVPLSRAFSDTRPTQNSMNDNFYPAPYHERSSSLPADASLFVQTRRSMSPPLRYSPPSSPLVSRNLFPSSASINSSLYSKNDDDDDNEEGSRLFSSIPQEDEQLAKLQSEYAEAILKLDALPRFSKEWFDVKTKTVQLEEQMENHENGSVGGLSHLSYGGVPDRSSAAWSEEDDEIMSFASDLELCMIGEALKQGNCMITPFDCEDVISPMGNNDYCDDDDILALDDCQFPNFEENENTSATLLQAEWRRYRQTRTYQSMMSAVIEIQALVRKRQAASKYSCILLSVVRIQSAWRSIKIYRSVPAGASVQSPAQRWYVQRSNAIRIQTAWRGSFDRKKFTSIRNSAVSIQSYVRMKQHQKSIRNAAHAVLIQSVLRGWLARNRIHQEKMTLSRTILQDQDSVHSRSIICESRGHSSPSYISKSPVAKPSIDVILSHHRALSLRRSQVPKFSDEWFYTTELIQGLEHELRLREREQMQDGNDDLLSLEDSRHDDELSGSIPSIRDSSSPSGHVMRIVQTIEENSRRSSIRDSFTSSGWTNVSNDAASASTKSANSAEEQNLKRLGKECLRLTRELENLPRFSDEWFQCKVELKSATDELEINWESVGWKSV
jgi:hypothetical protein